MRSAEQARESTVSHIVPRQLLACVVSAVLATLALLMTWHPVVVHAQESPPPVVSGNALPNVAQPAKTATGKATATKAASVKDTASTTHLVKAGETLWSITAKYYGDGHQWRAVARRNGIALSSDTALRIGTKLVIPSRKSVASVATASATLPVQADTTTPKVATTPAAPALPPRQTSGPVVTGRPSGALTAQTTGKTDATSAAVNRDVGVERTVLLPQVKAERMLTNVPTRIGLVDAADLQAARPRGESPTVFELRAPDASVAAASARAIALHAEAAPRHGEYAAAPYAMTEDAWKQAGRIMRRLENAASSNAQYARVQLAGEVEITPPLGATLAVGDRLVVAKHGGLLSKGVVVVAPTGILQVTRVSAGSLIHAYVRSESGVVEQGDALFAIAGGAAAVGQRFEPVSGTDVETSVTWIAPHEIMPTLQSYVLLAAGRGQGVKAGEQFALVRQSAKGGEDRIAVVRVVRVDESGSTAIVTGQSLPDIACGVKARRITRAF